MHVIRLVSPRNIKTHFLPKTKKATRTQTRRCVWWSESKKCVYYVRDKERRRNETRGYPVSYKTNKWRKRKGIIWRKSDGSTRKEEWECCLFLSSFFLAFFSSSFYLPCALSLFVNFFFFSFLFHPQHHHHHPHDSFSSFASSLQFFSVFSLILFRLLFHFLS